MRAISLKGLLLGIGAMVLLDLVVDVVLAAAFGGQGVPLGATAEQTRAASDALMRNTAFLSGSLILGTLTTVVGGYIAARVGHEAPYLNAGVFGVLGTVFSLLFAGGYPGWFALAAIIVVLPAALLGGHLAARPAASAA